MLTFGKTEAQTLLNINPDFACTSKICRNSGQCIGMGQLSFQLSSAVISMERCFCEDGFYGPDCGYRNELFGDEIRSSAGRRGRRHVSDNFDQVKKEPAEISARNDTQFDQKATNIFYCMPIFICLVSFLVVVLRKRARRV